MNFNLEIIFIIELKNAKLIYNNYYWFFNFDEISPLKKIKREIYNWRINP